MSEAQLYTEHQLVQTAKEHFAACLIISSASFMLFGYNIAQFLRYIAKFWRRDKFLTRCWAILVMALNTASVLYGGVYADWLVSISSWSSAYAHRNDVANGTSSILYGFTVTSVQLFWVGCIWRMMSSRPKLRLACCSLILLVLAASLSIAISVGAILINQTSDGISAAHSRLNRAADSLTLLADIIILIVIFSNIYAIKKSSKTLKRSISRLTSIFASVTCISSLLLIVEIVVIYPSTTQSRYIVDFTYFYAPTYTFAMFAILNARNSLHLGKDVFTFQDKDLESVEPQMHFTVNTNTTKLSGCEKEEEPEFTEYERRRTEPARLQTIEFESESDGGIETCP